MNLVVEKITKLEDLLGYRESWNSLAARTNGAQFFQTYDWLATYWRHYGSQQQLLVLMIRDAGGLLGIVPLVIREEKRRIGRLRVLTYPMDDWGSFFGPVTSDPERTISAAIEYLASQPKHWDILSWRWLDPSRASTQTIANKMQQKGMRVFPAVRETTALIDLPSTWEQYLASRGSKFRNNLRRWERRVNEMGTLRFEKYRPLGEHVGQADPRWDLYDACENLAARSWQGASESGTTLSHETIRPFLRDVHQAAVTLGAADLNLMYLNDTAVAFEYGYWWQGYKYSLRFGYDSDLCQAGVGNLMWLETIKASLVAGDHTFDMGPGSLEYKRYFLTRTCECQTLDHYRRFAPKAQMIAMKQSLTQWWSDAATIK